LKSFSAYQKAHSFYNEIKSERNNLLNSQGINIAALIFIYLDPKGRTLD
jgi:hypothetical protein